MRKFILLLSVVSIAATAHSQFWNLTGNAGTNPDINFIGTTDTMPLLFRSYNRNAGSIYPFSSNTAFGLNALFANPRGTWDLRNHYGSGNTGLGHSALYSNTTGGWNTATGSRALAANTTGGNNTATGMRALNYNNAGNYNTAIGALALELNTSGSGNTVVGSNSLGSTQVASYNTVMGYNVARNTLGWNNTLIGANSDVNTYDRYNCVALGQGTICTGNSQARIGNSATVSIGGYVGWSSISDGRYKKDIHPDVKGLEFIMKLQPVTYHLDIAGLNKKLDEGSTREKNEYMERAIKEKEKILYTGFIAQDVEKAAKETGYDFSGVDKPQDKNDLYGLRYAEFVVPLVKGMQEQQVLIQQQSGMINELIKQNENLQARVSELEKRNGVYPSIAANDVLQVRPNPSFDKVFVNITSASESQAVLKLFDTKGALLKEQRFNVLPGNNQLGIDINSLATGIYMLSAEWNKGQIKKTAQVIKQ